MNSKRFEIQTSKSSVCKCFQYSYGRYSNPHYISKKKLILLFCRKEKLQRDREALLAQHQSHMARGKAEAETSRVSKMKPKKQPKIRETAKPKKSLSQEELRNERTIKNREYRRAKKEREMLSKLVQVDAKKCNKKQQDNTDKINQSHINSSKRQKEKNKKHPDRTTTEVDQSKLQPETSKAATEIQREEIQTQKAKAPRERSKAPVEVQKETIQTEKKNARKERSEAQTVKLHTGSEIALVEGANTEREKLKNTGAKKAGIYQTKRRLLTEEEKRKNAIKESIYKRNKSTEDEEYSPQKSHPKIVAQKTVPLPPKPDKKSKTMEKIKNPKLSHKLPKSKSSPVQLLLPVTPKPRGRPKKVSEVEKPLSLGGKSVGRPKKVSDVINDVKTSSKTKNVRSSSKTMKELKSPVKMPTQGKMRFSKVQTLLSLVLFTWKAFSRENW